MDKLRLVKLQIRTRYWDKWDHLMNGMVLVMFLIYC